MKRLTIDIDDDLFRRLAIRCAELGKSKADVIRNLIQEFLAKP